MPSASASLFDAAAIAAVAAVVAVVLLVLLMRRAAAHPYRPVDFLLSPVEVELLAALRQALAGHYEVFPKVRLAALIDVRKGLTRKQHAEALEHIGSRQVGFVVCDPVTSAVRGVVEFEPATTRRRGRHRPVSFLEAALAAAHVPLVRVPAQSPYAPAELRDRVLTALGPTQASAAAPPGRLGDYFGPAAHPVVPDAGVVGRMRALRDRSRPEEGPGSAATWLPTRGVLAVAAVLLILGAVLSWFVEPSAPPVTPSPPPPPSSAAPPAVAVEPAVAAAAPPVEAAPAPEKPREIVGYRDVRVPGKPLSECMGPDREIGPEVLRCRDGYTRREPIYR